MAGLMIIGEKESFLIKALEKKLAENKISFFFCPSMVDDINAMWKDASLAVAYLNTGETFRSAVLHFLSEKLTEAGKGIILVGDKNDADAFVKGIGENHILERYTRPLDTEDFVANVGHLLKKEAEGLLKKRIMIVDDDTTYLGVIRDWLKSKYNVQMANSGMQAIRALGLNPVDLILLDYNMPVTTGPQVLEMLRSDPETAKIPVIFLTGRNDRESVVQVLSLKPEGYLLKTISKEELIAEVDEFFAKKQLGI